MTVMANVTNDPECSAPDSIKSAAMGFGAVKSAQEGGREVKLSEL